MFCLPVLSQHSTHGFLFDFVSFSFNSRPRVGGVAPCLIYAHQAFKLSYPSVYRELNLVYVMAGYYQ